MQSCFVKKCLCNQLNVTDKNYETKMAYITGKDDGYRYIQS